MEAGSGVGFFDMVGFLVFGGEWKSFVEAGSGVGEQSEGGRHWDQSQEAARPRLPTSSVSSIF